MVKHTSLTARMFQLHNNPFCPVIIAPVWTYNLICCPGCIWWKIIIKRNVSDYMKYLNYIDREEKRRITSVTRNLPLIPNDLFKVHLLVILAMFVKFPLLPHQDPLMSAITNDVAPSALYTSVTSARRSADSLGFFLFWHIYTVKTNFSSQHFKHWK